MLFQFICIFHPGTSLFLFFDLYFGTFLFHKILLLSFQEGGRERGNCLGQDLNIKTLVFCAKMLTSSLYILKYQDIPKYILVLFGWIFPNINSTTYLGTIFNNYSSSKYCERSQHCIGMKDHDANDNISILLPSVTQLQKVVKLVGGIIFCIKWVKP